MDERGEVEWARAVQDAGDMNGEEGVRAWRNMIEAEVSIVEMAVAVAGAVSVYVDNHVFVEEGCVVTWSGREWEV